MSGGSRMSGSVAAWLRLLRPRHWLKNALVCLPPLFAGTLSDQDTVIRALLAFAAFSLAASAVYIFNDVRDADDDRVHPTKRDRPIASGLVAPAPALAVAVALLCSATAVSAAASATSAGTWASLGMLSAYALANIAYSLGLKRVPLVDVSILAACYVLRVCFGAAVCGVEVSSWLFLTVLAMSLYLGLGKRRGESASVGSSAREVLASYTQGFLDRFMYAMLACALVFYSLWSAQASSAYMVYSVPVAMLACMRYCYAVERGTDGDSVGVVYGDRALLALIALWVVFVSAVLYAL